MESIGEVAEEEGVCYLVGGGTAVLLGWRETTIDVDLLFGPEQDSVLRALPAIKDELQLNVEFEDARAMVERGLVGPERLRDAFAEIEPRLYRFPAIDPADFRRRLDE